MTILPNEIIDKILFYLNDISLAIKLKRNYVINKLYNHRIHDIPWAARNGDIHAIKWIYFNKAEQPSVVFNNGKPLSGLMRLLLVGLDFRPEKSGIELAAEYGHLDIIKFLHFNRIEQCTTLAADLAAENGHIEIVKWLHRNSEEGFTIDAMNGAAKNGYLEVVIFLYSNRTEGCIFRAMNYAKEYGHFNVVKWLRKKQIMLRNKGRAFF